MLHNNVTSNTLSRDFLFALCSIPAELSETFTRSYNERAARNASIRNITFPANNPFDIINNFRRICERENREVAGE